MRFKADEILVISTEGRRVPFPNSNKMLKYAAAEDFTKFKTYLLNAISRDDIKVIIVDSLNRMIDLLLWDIENVYGFSGRQIWGEFGKQLRNILGKSTFSKKPIIWLSSAEVSQDEQGNTLSYAAAPGKTRVESFFDVVLHTLIIKNAEKDEDRYKFITNTDGVRFARSEYKMFPQIIPNDLGYVLDTIYQYSGDNINDKELQHHPSVLVTGTTGTGKTFSILGLTTPLEEGKTNEN